MTTDEQICELQRQVAEANAARRHAQEVSSALVKEKRAIEAQVAEARHSALVHSEVALQLYREKKGLQDELSQRVLDLEEVCATEVDLRNELARLRGFSDSLSSKFWSYEEKMCAEARAGLTQDQRTGAAIALHWIKEQFADAQNHSADTKKMVQPETIASVTAWANETFGQATVLAMVNRSRDEFNELLDLIGIHSSAEKLAEEAADVCICLYRVIGTLDPEAINKKMAINRARKWNVDGQGCAQHVGEETPAELSERLKAMEQSQKPKGTY